MVSRSGTEDGLARNILENVSLSNIARLYIQIKVEHFTGCHFEIFASYCIIFAETLVFFIHQIYSRNTQRLHFLPYELVCRPYPHEANSAGLVPFKISPGARNAAALPLQPFRLRGCPLPQGSASENPAPRRPPPRRGAYPAAFRVRRYERLSGYPRIPCYTLRSPCRGAHVQGSAPGTEPTVLVDCGGKRRMACRFGRKPDSPGTLRPGTRLRFPGADLRRVHGLRFWVPVFWGLLWSAFWPGLERTLA